MNWEIIMAAASELVTNVTMAVIALLGSYAVYYIRQATVKVKAQTATIQDSYARQVFENAVSDVSKLAEVTVGALEQTTAKALRDAVKAGTADREELFQLGQRAFNEVKAMIAPEAQRVITQTIGSFDEYLTKCIEDAVLRIKQQTPYLSLPGEVLEGVAVGSQ